MKRLPNIPALCDTLVEHLCGAELIQEIAAAQTRHAAAAERRGQTAMASALNRKANDLDTLAARWLREG